MVICPGSFDRLRKAKITSSSIEVTSGKTIRRESITLHEKPLFEVVETAITTTKETWLTGQINSMTKSTNSGHIYLSDGSRVYYKIKSREAFQITTDSSAIMGW